MGLDDNEGVLPANEPGKNVSLRILLYRTSAHDLTVPRKSMGAMMMIIC